MWRKRSGNAVYKWKSKVRELACHYAKTHFGNNVVSRRPKHKKPPVIDNAESYAAMLVYTAMKNMTAQPKTSEAMRVTTKSPRFTRDGCAVGVSPALECGTKPEDKSRVKA